jgi:hypothetical protein
MACRGRLRLGTHAGCRVHTRARGRRTIRGASLLDLLLAAQRLGRYEVAIRQLLAAHRQRVERRQAGGEGAVVDPLRMQLRIDVGREAHAPDLRHVARARAVSQPVEDVDDGRVVRTCGRILGPFGADRDRADGQADQNGDNRANARDSGR